MLISRSKPEPAEYVIGCDESGTGAWAGPFTVCAFMSTYNDTAHLIRVGARDSKKLTHVKRELVAEKLVLYGARVAIEKAGPTYTYQRDAWRAAVAQALATCLKQLPPRTTADVFIDGMADQRLIAYLQRNWRVDPVFLVQGEDRCPQIAAASIFAKLHRSELMNKLHQQHPQYGWSGESGHGNDGYGTEDHLLAIKAYGVTALHRRVKPLLPFFEAQESPVESSDGQEVPNRSRAV